MCKLTRPKYKICVRTLQRDNILTFKVEKYEVTEGFVTFTDRKTGEKRIFHGSNCEITELEGEF